MKIQQATKFDTDAMIEMLEHYRESTPIRIFDNYDNVPYVKQVLAHIFAGRGVAFIAYKKNVPIGLIVGIIDQSIWDKDLLVMKELAYWVEPEHRGTTAGYRLLSKYIEYGKELQSLGRIKTFTISKMTNSPDLDYKKFGFDKVEETWSMGV